MRHKIRKATRYWSAKLRPRSYTALRWHIGTPNFGDDINPAFFQELSGIPLRFEANRFVPHLLGMGSILQLATEVSVVVGSGLLEPVKLTAHPRVVALRGLLSLNTLGQKTDIPLGDPMVLVDRLVKPERGTDIGIVPHASSLPWARTLKLHGMRLIDVTRDPWSVVREIGRCRLILSQSLHGLIVADAFEIPNLWLAPSRQMKGGRFKFDDYFTTLDAPKTSHKITHELLQNPPLRDFSVGIFKGHKQEYQQILRSVILEGVRA